MSSIASGVISTAVVMVAAFSVEGVSVAAVARESLEGDTAEDGATVAVVVGRMSMLKVVEAVVKCSGP